MEHPWVVRCLTKVWSICSRSPKNPALQQLLELQLQESSKSASTTPQRPIWNTFGTVAVRDFSENCCDSHRIATRANPSAIAGTIRVWADVFFYGKHNTDESKREKHPAPLSVGRHPCRPVCRSRMNNNATTALSLARHEGRGRGPGNAHPPPPSLPLFPPSSGVPPAAACRLVPRHRSHAACGSRQHAWALAVKLRA